MNHKLVLKIVLKILFALVVLTNPPWFVHANPVTKNHFDPNPMLFNVFDDLPYLTQLDFAAPGHTQVTVSFFDVGTASASPYGYEPLILMPSLQPSALHPTTMPKNANAIIGTNEEHSIATNAEELLQSPFLEATPEPTAVLILAIGLIGLYLFKSWNAKNS